jgi:hypothetical protein
VTPTIAQIKDFFFGKLKTNESETEMNAYSARRLKTAAFDCIHASRINNNQNIACKVVDVVESDKSF